MTLTVGTDTYISLVDAEIYVSTHYRNVDPEFKAWGDNIDTDKEILLRKATQAIDRLPFVGVKSTSVQLLEFPRALYTDYANYGVNVIFSFEGMMVEVDTPQAVLDAQCEIALDLAKGNNERADLQRQGVKSFSLGKLSESYGSVKDISSFEARKLLAPYTAGSVRIL